MVSKINVSSVYSSINNDDVMYFKKLVVDMFLKSCYPLVHMVYMQALMEKYASSGDYINVRIIILATVFYVFYCIKYLESNINRTMPPANMIQPGTEEAGITNILTKIKNYLENNNKINLTSNDSANDEMKKIVVGLHDLSRDVTGQNRNIQITSEQIKENQITMRNIIFNIEVKRKEFGKARNEFIFALVLLIVFTIVNVLLLVLGLPDYVFYLSGFFGVIIIFYLIVMMIIRFVAGKR
jgi:hypothetical protein